MLGYIAKRLLSALPVLALVSIMVFLLIHLAPGDPASLIAGRMASPEQVERIRLEMGFDEPLLTQYFEWIRAILSGDFGLSVYYDKPVLELMSQRLEPSISLALGTLLVAITIALPSGIVGALYKGRWPDLSVMAFSSVGFSIPVFVVAYCMIYLLSVRAGLFPIQGYRPIGEGIWPWLQHIVLPCLSLGLVFSALIARITRAALVEVLAQDYIKAARAKGLPTGVILFSHALRNAAVPIVTVIGSSFVLLIGGVVVTETVFNIPGLGRLVVGAISQRDFPVIQGVIVVFATVYILINLCIDLFYTVIDPRIRY